MSLFRPLIPLALLAGLAACGGPEPPPPTIVNLTLQAGPDINADAAGEAKPVMVKVYRLGGLGGFLDADYFSLEADASGALGRDLVGDDAFTLAPGATEHYQREFEPDARYLGVVVAFRDIDRTSWRAHAPVPPNTTTRLVALIEGDSVTIRGEP